MGRIKKNSHHQTLGFVTTKKSSRGPRGSDSGMNVFDVETIGTVRPNADQGSLIMPPSDWVRPLELPSLEGVQEIALDTETVDRGLAKGLGPGWAFNDGYVAGVGVAWRTGAQMQRIYVPVAHPDTDNFNRTQVASWLTEITRNKRVVMFNAGYDIGWLKASMGVPVPPVIDDASCAAFLVDENRDDLSLDGVCAWRGVEGKDLAALHEAARAFGFAEKDAVKNIGKLPARYAAAYGSQDPVSTLLVMEDLRKEMAKQELEKAYATEMRLVPLTHAMRLRGVKIDIDRALQFQEKLRERADQACAKLTDLLEQRVTIKEVRSHEWLVRTCDRHGIKTGRRGDKATFERDWMRRSEHPVVRAMAEARQCQDMADKFVGKYLLDFAHNGRVHASVNQWLYEEGGTRSHRLSYADPPLQQAPSRGEPFEGWPLTLENATEYRSCFLPEEGELWFSPDYSQQEYRLIVADAEKNRMTRGDVAAQKYRDDPKTDFHNLVVELTGLQRRHAKDCNFAKSYGAGIAKFAAMTGKTETEAADIMGTYDRELPFVRQLSQYATKLADRRGYIVMFDGARAHFDKWEVAYLKREEWQRGIEEGHRMDACSMEEAKKRQDTIGHPWRGERLKRAFTHKALNRRIQGNAARQMKLAMAQCWDEGLVPLLQLHDELAFSLPVTEQGKKDGDRIVEIMKTAYQCSVPFLVDAEWGRTWGDAKHSGTEFFVHESRGAGERRRGKGVRAAGR